MKTLAIDILRAEKRKAMFWKIAFVVVILIAIVELVFIIL